MEVSSRLGAIASGASAAMLETQLSQPHLASEPALLLVLVPLPALVLVQNLQVLREGSFLGLVQQVLLQGWEDLSGVATPLGTKRNSGNEKLFWVSGQV